MNGGYCNECHHAWLAHDDDSDDGDHCRVCVCDGFVLSGGPGYVPTPLPPPPMALTARRKRERAYAEGWRDGYGQGRDDEAHGLPLRI